MKKCKICNKELTGYKTKFCGNTCYLNHKSESAKKLIVLSHRDRSPKECSICKTEFYPIRADHSTCSKPCSSISSKLKQTERRVNNRKFKKVRPFEFAKTDPFLDSKYVPEIILKTTAEFNSSSTTKDEVLAYLKSGGKIQQFPDEVVKKTSDVNIPFEYTDEELYGISEDSEQPALEQVYGNQH